ncbi:MAG TPA: hypothetical protein VHN98_13315 [Acidimicrobiales bacterium]|nr:hypothetical protein [Acidimicrobiales bacterium]
MEDAHLRAEADLTGPLYGPPAPAEGVLTTADLAMADLTMPDVPDTFMAPAPLGDPVIDPGDGPVGDLGPDTEGHETIEQIRARLAARGLLRESTTPLPDLPAPAPPPMRARFTSDLDEVTRSILEDEVDQLDYAPAATPMTLGGAQCPACSAWFGVPSEATGFRCRSCERAWRWGICQSCDQLSLTPEKQDSWRCQLCGHFTRSWWQAPAPAAHRAAVVDRRKRTLKRLEDQRRKAEKRHNRRMYLVAGALATILLAMGLVTAIRRPPAASDVGHGVCAQFGHLKTDIVNGTASRDEVSSRIDTLVKAAAKAPPKVASAAAELKDAGPPGTAQFLVAQTALSDACDAG